MKVLSLFSGVGGFDMGLENAGMQTVFQCEWDKHANTILNKHWPHVPKWEDVSTLTGKHILTHAPVIDVVAWGSPCQDLSVAGKRSGLEGERSGLFHEGIRIIKELRKETNGQYPRISIWENVVGALNSNRGADFGIIINEMAEAGAMVIEWAVLDAQYFGVPQRRRRVFVIAIFDPAIAERCPSPLLPVAESLPGHLAKSKPKRKSAAGKTATSIGTDGAWWDGRDTAEALTTTSNEQRMPDKQRFQAIVEQEVVGTLTVSDLVKQVNNEIIGKGLLQVVEDRQPYTPSSFAQYKEEDMNAVATLRAGGGDLGGGSEVLIAEPYVKSSRAQTADDSETWVEGKVNPTLNSFDQGDVRATTAIVEELMLVDGRRTDDVRVYAEPVQTLEARMGTGGNNVPMLAFDTKFGSNANVTENVAPTLKSSQAPPSVAYPIQDGRDIEKHQNGLGVGDEHSPAYTIDQTGAQAVAYGIQGSMIGRQDHNGPAGKGHTDEGDPMFTLTSTDIHAVAYDEYNDTIGATHHALRAGTKQSTGVLIDNEVVGTLQARDYKGINHEGARDGKLLVEHEVVGTLRSGGDGGVPSSRGEHLVTEPTMAVRRLTPLECERLMGWPDHHTRYKADGTEQTDGHRYKQCGNGVASPVAQWIAKHLLKLEEQQ